MLQMINKYLQKKADLLQKRQELQKAKKYYQYVKAGRMFIEFVQKDLKHQTEQVNRHMRRRMERDLLDKGVLSEELIQHYGQKVDWVLNQIEQRLNPPKRQKNKPGETKRVA
jgi:hypothetical protein